MGLTIQTRPDSVNGVVKSKFTAARNPVIYRFQRKDYTFNTVVNAGGNALVTFNGIDLTSYFEVDDIVYWKSDDGVYASTSTVLERDYNVAGSGNTRVRLGTYISNSTTGFMNNLVKRTDWKVTIEVFCAYNNRSLTDGLVKFDYFPNKTGAVIADISEVLKPFVKPDWVKNFFNCEFETESGIEFYIKYNEYFDGVAQSVTNDSANPLHAVNAAMQVYYGETTYGHGGNMLSYQLSDFGRSWMNQFYLNSVRNKVRAWRGYQFTLSFLENLSNTNPLRLVTKQYQADMINVTRSVMDLVNTSGTVSPNASRVHRVNPFANGLLDSTKKMELIMLQQTEVVNLSGSDGLGTVSGVVTNNIALGASRAAGTYYFQFYVTADPTGSWGSSNVTFDLYARRSSDGTVTLLKTQTLPANGSNPNQIRIEAYDDPIAIAHDFDQLRFVITPPAGNYDWSYSSTNCYVQQLVMMPLYIEDACDNPIYLFWKGSSGGDQFKLFELNQEWTYKHENGKKAKRLLLIAYNLDSVEWEAINELNSHEEIYRNYIAELHSGVIKTSSQINQQVYIIDASGNQKIGVVVVPKQPKTESRRSKHQIEIEIEIPEVL
jgi:hypothetical protein